MPATAKGNLETTRLGQKGARRSFPLWILKYLPNMVAAHISLAFNAQGPNSTITTACAAGTQAVGEAFRLIARDDADIVLAGGADSRIDPLLILAYAALGALSTIGSSRPRKCRALRRPARRLRSGRRGGVLVLEELEHAKKRGAIIYAEVLGLGSSFDAYAATKPDPEAKGAARAIKESLREAKHRPGRRRLHQRPRHQHAPQRSDGDDGRQTRLRRECQGVAAVVDQVDGRPSDRRGRGGGGGGPGPDALQRRHAADDQSDAARSGTAISITCPTPPARCR